jgi:hypothetical protein
VVSTLTHERAAQFLGEFAVPDRRRFGSATPSRDQNLARYLGAGAPIAALAAYVSKKRPRA